MTDGSILVTGAAGFIGAAVADALLARGAHVIGVDNLNDYYDVRLKRARLDRLTDRPHFSFHQIDISDRDRMLKLAADFPGISHIVHLAAQAGVRYSLVNPYAYITANVMGQVVMQELARALPALSDISSMPAPHPSMAPTRRRLSRWVTRWIIPIRCMPPPSGWMS